MLGTHLHLALRSLCFDTEWKYAVFWKLKHHTRIWCRMLTWEDAYYDQHKQHSVENKCISEALDNLHNGYYLRDPLGLAVAMMSYHVYSLGEGIVGHVAVTGQHQWVFADENATNQSTSLRSSDGWQTQFCAGIRTVAVVAVVPHGVIQLGSLNKVTEDLKLVNHIRSAFYALQGSSVGCISNPIQCHTDGSLFMADVPTESSCSKGFHNRLVDHLDKSINKERSNACSSMFPPHGRDNNSAYSVPMPNIHQERTAKVINKNIGSELSKSGEEGSSKIVKAKLETSVLESQNQVHRSDAGIVPPSLLLNTLDLYKLVEHSGVNFAYSLNFETFDRVQCDDDVDCHQKAVLQMPKLSNRLRLKELEIKSEKETGLSCIDSLNSLLKFSAGSELHEVLLGSAFLKPNTRQNWEKEEEIKAETTLDVPEGTSTSQLALDFGSDLLEAVVADVCQSTSETKSEKLFSQSMLSLLTTEREHGVSNYVECTAGSAGYSIDQPSLLMDEDSEQCLTYSDACGVKLPKGFSSTCPSACSEQSETSAEPVKTNKRPRPGENCRPRSRDRQLIQDRIKELRDLVPNGLKCSIDSLLERTIKHMLFVQSITKYADKLKERAESKLYNMDQSMLGSSAYEHGSSWAVELGSHMKVFPIVVENLNMNGQLLVEMFCEECSQFLEIAEAIRSLGLTILKGVTESRGKKSWICFVVEGQNNRTIHRMEVLCSLVQTLQPKTTV